jgi:probable rRNA maturation factor
MVELFYEQTTDLGLDSVFFKSWFSRVSDNENKELGDINLIFCSDDYLLEMNQQHLSHDFFTDIITFDYSFDSLVAGDLFISVDRIRENASDLSVSFEDELHRVCCHGILHLCGYSDKTENDQILMRSKEDAALIMRFT